MNSEYVEERNGGFYISGTRISLDSVVYSFERGNSPEAIQESFPLLKRAQILWSDCILFGSPTASPRVSGRKGAPNPGLVDSP